MKMEKIIKLLVKEKVNPLGEIEPDIPGFLKSAAYITIALMSISFAAGNYLSAARRLPERMEILEIKTTKLQFEQEVSAVRFETVQEILIAIKADVREIRVAQMRGCNER